MLSDSRPADIDYQHGVHPIDFGVHDKHAAMRSATPPKLNQNNLRVHRNSKLSGRHAARLGDRQSRDQALKAAGRFCDVVVAAADVVVNDRRRVRSVLGRGE
jgi:hypothetical protein